MLNLKFFGLLLMIFAASLQSQNNGLKKGDVLPNPEIHYLDNLGPQEKPQSLYDYKQDHYLLIAVIPDITDANPSAKIILTGLDAYFSEGLSFRSFEEYRRENPRLKVLVVTSNSKDRAAEIINKYNLNFELISDKNLDITNSLGITKWNSSSDASFIYIADKENKILYANDNFKGEGEKLKSIQTELYSCFNLKENIAAENSYPVLMHGDEARDFTFTAAGSLTTEEVNLSDYKGKKNVLLAFYPAPFSMSCSYEVSKFDTFAEEQLMQRVNNSGMDDIELLMVSYSNNYILSKWKEDMGITSVKLVNDFDGSISMKYNSYNPFGYSNRTVFLINKEGRVEYIDWDYNVNNDNDFGIIKEMLTASK